MISEYKLYKNFNKKIIKIIIICILLTGVINYIVNPYNIFTSKITQNKLLKPKMKLQERYTKFMALKMDKRQIDTVFVGSSRVDWALSKEYYKQITGKEAENLGMGGLYVSEYTDIINALLLIHPEVKNIYLGIDFAAFSKNRKDKNIRSRYKIIPTKEITSSEIGFALFSIKTLYYSIWTVIKNLIGIESRMYNPDGTKHVYIDNHYKLSYKGAIIEYKSYYKNFDFDEDAYKILQNVKEICEKKGINVYFFIMPSHIYDLYLIDTMSYNLYTKWKTGLVQIADVIDFQYPSIYAEEELSPEIKYFFEAAHSTNNMGNIIIDVFAGANNDFGHKLNKDNVGYYLKKDREELKKYINITPEIKWVDEVI